MEEVIFMFIFSFVSFHANAEKTTEPRECIDIIGR